MDELTRERLASFSARLNFLREYPLWKLPDGKYWTDNLRVKIEGAVWNEEYNCFMYSREQAQKVVPPGFHLPSKDEFEGLYKALGYGQLKDKEVVQRLINDCGFVYSGYSHETNGSLHSQGTSGGGWWWSSTWYSATYAYSLHFDSSAVYPSDYGSKDYGFAVRCIKDN